MLYESKEEKERAEQNENVKPYPHDIKEVGSDKMFENKNENEDREKTNEEVVSLSDKDILVVCSAEEYESDFQVFKSIEEAEHYIVETQNIENDLYIISNADDVIQNYDINIINRLFKSYKFISAANAVESGLIKEKEVLMNENKVAEYDGRDTNNEELNKQGSYSNDFDSASLFLNEE